MNIRQIEIDLDNAWWGHGDIKYEDKLSSVKLMGFRVYRNSEGKHKPNLFVPNSNKCLPLCNM